MGYTKRNHEGKNMNTAMKWDTILRDGERQTTAFRSQRIFTINNSWYFNTREGIDHGPFISRAVAELAIESYIRRQQSTNKKSLHHTTAIYDRLKKEA